MLVIQVDWDNGESGDEIMEKAVGAVVGTQEFQLNVDIQHACTVPVLATDRCVTVRGDCTSKFLCPRSYVLVHKIPVLVSH